MSINRTAVARAIAGTMLSSMAAAIAKIKYEMAHNEPCHLDLQCLPSSL